MPVGFTTTAVIENKVSSCNAMTTTSEGRVIAAMQQQLLVTPALPS